MSQYHYIWAHAPQADKETVRRKNILCIVKHREKDAYLLLDWEKMDWKSFVMGGIDNDDIIEAGIREINEETAYIDVRYVDTLDIAIHSEYYASHKWVNRYSENCCLVYQLHSGSKRAWPIDDENHSFHRVDADKVETFLLNVPWTSESVLYWYYYTGKQEKFDEYVKKFTKIL